MNSAQMIFWVYGVAIILIDSYAIYKPKRWIEYIERQFIYRRQRVTAAGLLLLLGLIPIYWILQLSGFQVYILAAASTTFVLLGLLIGALPDVVRNGLLSVAAMDDKWARLFFASDALAGVILILFALFL